MKVARYTQGLFRAALCHALWQHHDLRVVQQIVPGTLDGQQLK